MLCYYTTESYYDFDVVCVFPPQQSHRRCGHATERVESSCELSIGQLFTLYTLRSLSLWPNNTTLVPIRSDVSARWNDVKGHKRVLEPNKPVCTIFQAYGQFVCVYIMCRSRLIAYGLYVPIQMRCSCNDDNSNVYTQLTCVCYIVYITFVHGVQRQLCSRRCFAFAMRETSMKCVYIQWRSSRSIR